MKVYTAIRKGAHHQIFCEDFLATLPVNKNHYVGAIFDGCSSGIDAHFSSALFGKLLKKVVRHVPFNDDSAPKETTKLILKEFIRELTNVRDLLEVEENELLSTIILLVFNKVQDEAFVIAIGDGVITINGDIHEIDQNNMPEYLAYDLNNMQFDEWFARQRQTFVVKNPVEITIASDGIGTFKSAKSELDDTFDVIHYLLIDNQLENNPTMLSRKCNILANTHGYQPMDDLSMIRIKF